MPMEETVMAATSSVLSVIIRPPRFEEQSPPRTVEEWCNFRPRSEYVWANESAPVDSDVGWLGLATVNAK